MPLAGHLERPDGTTVRVRVKGGYQPATIAARVGEPLRVVFSREETAPCSEHVVFPAFGKSTMLPAFEDVTLELVPEHAGEYEFTCQLGMLRGRLVVYDPAATGASAGTPGGGPVRARWSSPSGEPADTVLLAFVTWLCSAPLLLLVTVPLVGWRTGGLLALAWLALVAGICLAVCVRRLSGLGALRRQSTYSAGRKDEAR